MSNIHTFNNARVINTTRENQMSVYDALPIEFRELIGNLPVCEDVYHIQECINRYGKRLAYDRIVTVFAREYPGWKNG